MSMLQRVSSLFLLCLLFGTGLGSPVILAQSLPEFDVDYVSKKSDRNPDRSRIDLFTRIGMPQLRFYNKGGQFQAHYEVTVDIFETNTKGEPVRKVITDNWDRTVTARNYEETQNEKISDTSTHARNTESIRPKASSATAFFEYPGTLVTVMPACFASFKLT